MKRSIASELAETDQRLVTKHAITGCGLSLAAEDAGGSVFDSLSSERTRAGFQLAPGARIPSSQLTIPTDSGTGLDAVCTACQMGMTSVCSTACIHVLVCHKRVIPCTACD